ncbi:uncharacterized protein TRIADDRAFT_59795 [Trichoplax adhaerens]|uniref:tRNA (adenine(58)-N(1))-methyltransferase n=1 Tax=Trichoplax adhaerens TaxID=10228 RepID=B3S6G3_TRIAD|nr:hypothetical protein TRIADDRAFT_59795 [Trichoplax adhaerens]EDV21616.1 hypothetical protein TRIADDRAFT_59795 [Trichoplax adhaerens]|eukprot:XP_002115764.1 hypothetical protein TRIADDRAFT_59795 [Trichoplax adhaerens]
MSTGVNLLHTINDASLESPFKYDEIVMAEHRKGRKRLFRLTVGGQFASPLGIIPYAQIVGTNERSTSFTSHQVLFYRPTLEDYILHMKRGPTVTYPKDAAAMVTMMDIGCGSKVLESGSGSGGLTLFLSRAVGNEGRIDSYEVRSGHLEIARKNVQAWKGSWNVNHLQTWPDNIYFFHQDVIKALTMPTDVFDAVALDLQDLSDVLPFVLKVLRIGRPVVAYLPNITQVITTLQRIKQQSLPFSLDRVVEVYHKLWHIAPSKTLNFSSGATHSESNAKKNDYDYYLARPSHAQHPHTGIENVFINPLILLNFISEY